MLVNYSSLASLDGFPVDMLVSTASLSNPAVTFDVANASLLAPFRVAYDIGTIDIVSNLQTLNVLICVLLFIQLVIMFFVSYYVIMTRFRFGRG